MERFCQKMYPQNIEELSTNGAEWVLSATSNLHIKSPNETKFISAGSSFSINAIKKFQLFRQTFVDKLAVLYIKSQVLLLVLTWI